jgi:hypothetical protein
MLSVITKLFNYCWLPVFFTGLLPASCLADSNQPLLAEHSPSPSLRMVAHYIDESGKNHRLVLERHGDNWLQRTTDGQLQLYARKLANGEMELRLLDDMHRKVLDARRTALYQIGIFQDWQQLAQQLTLPKRPLTMESIAAPQSTVISCQWMAIKEDKSPDAAYQLCWSSQWNMAITLRKKQPDGQWVTLFNTESIVALSGAEKDRWPEVPKDYLYANVSDDLQAD